MADLTFFSRTGEQLPYDDEDECAVVKQYGEGWFVRGPSADDPPYIKAGARSVKLVWDDGYKGHRLPFRRTLSGTQAGLLDQVTRGVGLLWLYASVRGGGERALTPPLYVGPGSLTEEEYSSILARLQQIAVSLEGVALAPVLSPLAGAPVQVQTGRNDTTDRMIENASAFLRLFETLRSSWPLIARNPARQLTLAAAFVDSARAGATASARVAQRCSQRPDLRRHEILTPQVTVDTTENRFLRDILDATLARKAPALADMLRARAAWLRSARSQPPPRAGYRYINIWRQGRNADNETAQKLDDLAARIRAAGREAEEWLREPFLSQLPNYRSRQTPLTRRLTDSIEYGPVFRAYAEYRAQRPQAASEAQDRLVWALQERLISPSTQLYELWTVVETHAMLVERFGFRPVGPAPLDQAEMIGDATILKSEAEFALEFAPPNVEEAPDHLIRLTLLYEPKEKPTACNFNKRCYNARICRPGLYCYDAIQPGGKWARQLTPDIVLDLEWPARQERFKLVLDAKYRRYAEVPPVRFEQKRQFGVETPFEEDLFGVGKMKYYDALCPAAAYILHSDPDPQYTVLGNDRLAVAPLRERSLGMQGWWPGHRIGAICVTPKRLDHLEQVIRCFLMYHAGLVDVCWRCGRVLTEENEGRSRQPGWQGDYYQCGCGNFWIVQVCQNRAHHTLIKLGRDSFHRTMPGNVWQCVCPECGDAPDWGAGGPPKRIVQDMGEIDF